MFSMLFAYRVTAGQEAIVADLLYEKIKKMKSPINALIVSPRLRGYLIAEASDELEAKRVIINVPHVKGMLHKNMEIADITELLESKPAEITLNKDDLVEVTAGPFKGEKAKVIRLNPDKEEVTVELIEVAVPIPVTIKLNTIKVLPK
ncbi:transcription elongation factor Spt5 [Candidatus Micrarchaeota archaeon CG1_02_55_22]|nr:MAG: transcription elongation factor Spt5 [Candidatus Micrarchaeota archaeon CG1_02_55_22]